MRFLLAMTLMFGCQPKPEVVEETAVMVPIERLKEAFKRCKPNGGIKFIYIRPKKFVCNNGAEFHK